MSEGTALNGKPLSEVAANHAALFSGKPSAYDDINSFNTLLKDSMRQFLHRKDNALDTFQAALKERAALLSSPEVRSNPDARAYLEGIIVRDADPAKSLEQTVAMHGLVEDTTYKGEPAKVEADKSTAEPTAIL